MWVLIGKILVRIAAQSATTNRGSSQWHRISKLRFHKTLISRIKRKKKLQLQENLLSQSYLVFTKNPPANLKLLDITDLKNITRILPAAAGSTFNVLVPATSVSKKLICLQSIHYSSIVPVSFRTN